MSHPYNAISNARLNNPGSPTKHVAGGMNPAGLQPFHSTGPPALLQVHAPANALRSPPGLYYNAAPDQWHTNHSHLSGTPPPPRPNVNGVPPTSDLRASPLLPNQPPSTYSPHNSHGYPPHIPSSHGGALPPGHQPRHPALSGLPGAPPLGWSRPPPIGPPGPQPVSHPGPPLGARHGPPITTQPGPQPGTLGPRASGHRGPPPIGPPHSTNTGMHNHVSGVQSPSHDALPQFNPHAPPRPPISGNIPLQNTSSPLPPSSAHIHGAPPTQNMSTGRIPHVPPSASPYMPAGIRPPVDATSMGFPPHSGSQPVRSPAPAMYPPRQPGPGHPPAPGQFPHPSMPGVTHGMSNMGFDDKYRAVDLMKERRIIPEKKHVQKPLRFENGPGGSLVPPNRKNCNPEVFRSTLNSIPVTQALLNKVKLPLGLIIHPFKDLSSLPVISAGTIVRCKRCRTYINPFVDFLDARKWRCNLCFVVNDVPEEFLHHPVTKTYGEPHTRPECTNSTLEFIAPQEYMVRPPQPAVYMFLFDVSHAAIETGYLQIVCDSLLDHIDHLPGDARTKIGFLSYNGSVHFYRLAEGASQPQIMIVTDLDDIFLPTPDSLLVNLRERKELVCDLIRQLPELHEFSDDHPRSEVETQSALGAALQAAQKMMAPYGGRVTIFQQTMPTTGPGSLKPREDPNTRAGEVSRQSLNPSTDFYKKLALDCSGHQVAMDFFFLNSQYIDISTLSCTSRFSAGDLHYYPGLHVKHNPVQAERLARDLDRYLTRKVGFEAVMRIRCTKGLAIHTFHGNFFVRSTDLLALANINPDAGFGLNLSIEESLTDLSSICIQAALLYTSSKGERRIRVHTMCFPVAKQINEVFSSVDSDAVVCLLSKMAVDRSITASIPDARDALVNAIVDSIKAYKESVSPGSVDGSLLVPPCMKNLPLALSCLLKHPAFRGGVSTRLDDRVFAMIDLKMQPCMYSLQSIHPDLYRVDDLTDENGLDVDERIIPQPPLLPLSAESMNRGGVYLLDTGWHLYLHVDPYASREFLSDVLGVKQFSEIDMPMYSIPDLDNPQSDRFHNFLEWLQDQRPHYAPLQVLRADSREHYFFMLYMRKDKTESSMSYQEFLQHIKQQTIK